MVLTEFRFIWNVCTNLDYKPSIQMPLFLAVGLLQQCSVSRPVCPLARTSVLLFLLKWLTSEGTCDQVQVPSREPTSQIQETWRLHRDLPLCGPVTPFFPELTLRAPQLGCRPWAWFCNRPTSSLHSEPQWALGGMRAFPDRRSGVHDHGFCRKKQNCPLRSGGTKPSRCL